MRQIVLLGAVFSLTGCLRVGMDELEAANDVGAEAPVAEAPVVQYQVAVNGGEGDEAGEPAATAEVPAASTGAGRKDPTFFRMGAGYGALGRLDLATCKSEGLAPGYVRLHVTFHVSGRVVRAAVESPTAPPSEALECISEQLELAWVPAFEGGEVTLSKSYFVN